ncbi:MAG: GspH/FimT family pseudopilin [Rubrivivax sp.]
MRPRRLDAGFTLLEMGITLAVMAILATLAVPGSAARIERARLESTAQTLAADLGNARLEAAQRGLPLHVQMQEGSNWCWAVSAQPGCDCSAPAACQIHRVDAGRGTRLKLLDAHSVQLDPGGIATPTPVATLQSGSGDRLRVSLTPLGRARLCLEASATRAVWRLPAC